MTGRARQALGRLFDLPPFLGEDPVCARNSATSVASVPWNMMPSPWFSRPCALASVWLQTIKNFWPAFSYS